MHPILIDFGFWKLSSYGAMVALAYLAAILWLKSRIKELGLTEEKFWYVIYCLFFGAILGGKLLYVAVEWRSFASGELGFFRDFRYGFVFFGGFLGASLMGLFAAWRKGAAFLPVADYFGVAVPLGQAIGRLGCLGAGCCYGRPTRLPWGIALGGNPACVVPQNLWGTPLHPTQLYESAADFLIFVVLLVFALPRVKSGKLKRGTVFLGYMLLYALARFAVEFYRGDERGGFLWSLSVSQWIALGCFTAAGLAMARRGIWARPS